MKRIIIRLRAHIIIAVISLPLAILASNFTADSLSRPAAQLMGLVRGAGTSNLSVDEKGVPLVFINRLGGTYRNPVTTSLFSLTYYARWTGESIGLSHQVKSIPDLTPDLTNDGYREYFLNTADWLVANLRIRSDGTTTYGVWVYEFRVPVYDIDPPWVSGMAQGLGIQVLTKAYNSTGDPRYLEAAKTALNALFVEVKDGGVTYKDEPDKWWYEEYAHPDGPEPRVLNGMEFALLGIHELYELTGDEDAKLLFDKGIASLETNIDKYDAGWWTYYDLVGQLANIGYQKIHINLTNRLYTITNNEKFLDVTEKWSKYEKSYFIREFVKQRPNYHDLTIVGLNGIGIFLALEALLLTVMVGKRMIRKSASDHLAYQTAEETEQPRP